MNSITTRKTRNKCKIERGEAQTHQQPTRLGVNTAKKYLFIYYTTTYFGVSKCEVIHQKSIRGPV